ncbi:thiamine pyrophosphate-dependent enzyme [Saccharomonospora sp.]|uniref:thiamine pyrophosphate-binding protein n=1 Tax=Saccharomonospora sp. TaxID=33913 RepID=UPI00261A929D|nr:thiamine pyrophosphate-dependent enzyme [Saccharomonospora sp.]
MAQGRSCWDVVTEVLSAFGCTTVFGLPSDEPGLLDQAAERTEFDVRVIGDQRVAACAAAGYAITAGKPAVLALNSGPSFANAIPGLLECASLSAPLVVVTTRVPAENIGRGGFQYLDQQGMAADLVTWRYVVDDPSNLAWAVGRAVRLASAGRGGITLIELTDEVVRAEIPDSGLPRPVPVSPPAPAPEALTRAADLAAAAERPLLVVGGGARGVSPTQLESLADALGAAVFCTAAGRGVMPESSDRFLGLVGLYTTPPAGRILEDADLLVIVGSRFEETARMGWDSWRDIPVVHVDVDDTAFGESVEPSVPILADAALTVPQLLHELSGRTHPDRTKWAHRQRAVRAEQSALTDVGFDRSPTRATLAALQREIDPISVLVQENGLHDIWSYHYPVTTLRPGTRVVCPGEQTMMGFGFAASVGAAIATDEGTVVTVTGDSAFLLNVNVLNAFREHRLGVVVVILDNQGYGWPRHLRASEQVDVTLTERRAHPSVTDLATAFGGWGCDVADERQLSSALAKAIRNSAQGIFSLIRVPVHDKDVPVGILNLDNDSEDTSEES